MIIYILAGPMSSKSIIMNLVHKLKYLQDLSIKFRILYNNIFKKKSSTTIITREHR